MDASEALLRAFALRLALLTLAVFVAQNLPDNRQPMTSDEKAVLAMTGYDAGSR